MDSSPKVQMESGDARFPHNIIDESAVLNNKAHLNLNAQIAPSAHPSTHDNKAHLNLNAQIAPSAPPFTHEIKKGRDRHDSEEVSMTRNIVIGQGGLGTIFRTEKSSGN